MNKNFKITCGLLVYGFGTVVLFSNNEWYWILLGSLATLLSTICVLKQANKGGN